MKLRWSAHAADQLLGAIAYQDDARPGAGPALRVAVDELVVVIAEYPRAFQAVPGMTDESVRRAFLRRWGYWLVFEIGDDDAIVVLALWHARRRPRGWQTD